MGTFAVVVLMLIFVIAIAALAFSVRVVKQYEKGLVIRLGRYNHTADAGLVFLIPVSYTHLDVYKRQAFVSTSRPRSWSRTCATRWKG